MYGGSRCRCPVSRAVRRRRRLHRECDHNDNGDVHHPITISYSYSYPFFRVSFVTSETSSDLAFTLSWLLRLDAMCPPAAASRTEYSQQKVLANKNERSLSSRFSYINKLSDITSRRLRIQKNKCQFVHKKMSITEQKEKKCNK